VFRGPDRTYLTVALDPADAVPPRSANRIARSSPDPDPDRRIPMSTRARAPSGPDRPPPEADPEAPDPLAESETLKATLAETAARPARLGAALEAYHRGRRTFRAAWSGLRALNLGS
jgi:hypothetical protein